MSNNSGNHEIDTCDTDMSSKLKKDDAILGRYKNCVSLLWHENACIACRDIAITAVSTREESAHSGGKTGCCRYQLQIQ